MPDVSSLLMNAPIKSNSFIGSDKETADSSNFQIFTQDENEGEKLDLIPEFSLLFDFNNFKIDLPEDEKIATNIFLDNFDNPEAVLNINGEEDKNINSESIIEGLIFNSIDPKINIDNNADQLTLKKELSGLNLTYEENKNLKEFNNGLIETQLNDIKNVYNFNDVINFNVGNLSKTLKISDNNIVDIQKEQKLQESNELVLDLFLYDFIIDNNKDFDLSINNIQELDKFDLLSTIFKFHDNFYQAQFNPINFTQANDIQDTSVNPEKYLVQTPIESPEWSRDIFTQVSWFSQQNIKSAKIEINPPHLGPLEINIDLDSNRAHVSFGVSHQQVRDILEKDVGVLKEMLSSQGLQLGDFGVFDQSSQSQKQPENYYVQNGNYELNYNSGNQNQNPDLQEKTMTKELSEIEPLTSDSVIKLVDYYA